MRVIVVGNQKGGVGKTATVVSVARGRALRGKQVLIMDCDSQGQAATFLGLERGPAMFNLLDPNNEQVLSELTQPANSSIRRRPRLDIVLA